MAASLENLKILLDYSLSTEVVDKTLERQGYNTLEAKLEVLKQLGYKADESLEPEKTEKRYEELLEKVANSNSSF